MIDSVVASLGRQKQVLRPSVTDRQHLGLPQFYVNFCIDAIETSLALSAIVFSVSSCSY